MKIRELIEFLQTHDPEMLVMVDGYEGGFTDVDIAQTYTPQVALNVSRYKDKWYYGPHDYVEKGDTNSQIVLVLGR